MPVPLTLAWVDAYALEKLHSLSKVDRYLARARELLAAGKLQQCTWQDGGGLQAAAAGSSAADAYSVTLLPAEPGPYTTSCNCPSHDKDGVCKHALAALLKEGRSHLASLASRFLD
ncbi:hypothetical protein OEZ86_005089 [Tetradesmus obliquus]|nr:hypothetical protein OEZ86_005089 [Tetradesmus obliquus]